MTIQHDTSFRSTAILLLLLCLLPLSFLAAQDQQAEDNFTKYVLLAPETNQFQMIYEVSATTPGAKYYYNTLRFGNEHKVSGAYDMMTGDSLKWEIVKGNFAKRNGFSSASLSGEYLKVDLARPVPEGGEARIRIDKTYKNASNYFKEGKDIVFSRSLGIKRNAIVLPKGYELVACNYPSQVTLTAEGQIMVSFMNRGNRSVPFKIKARPVSNPPKAVAAAKATASPPAAGSGRDKSKARVDYMPPVRTYQDREIVYFLQEPSTHSFRLYHDYTETRPGTDKYLNVVRPGSKASKPSAMILDTGEKLEVETLKGDAITKKGIELSSTPTAETEVVVINFEPVKEGQSVRLRIEETYTDPDRYLVHNGELVWDRSFGRNRNTVILPKGWYLTASSMPAVIEETPGGEISLFFMNDRPDNMDVFIRGRKR